MVRRPAFAKAFADRWRIVEMDIWSDDVLGIGGEAHLSFARAEDGGIAFIAVKAFLDVRYSTRDGQATAEFTFEGIDEGDPICGRGWASLGTAGRLVGHIYIHKGDDSGFVCEPG